MNTFLLLTSPPASGKTYWIESYYKELKEPLLVVSPLKALAIELEQKWGGKISVCTPEAYLMRPQEASVVIFDEWHLLFYWGDHFREKMWQAFYEISQTAKLCIGLTATFNEDIKKKVKEWNHFDEFLWVNQGNQVLKYQPTELTRIFSKKLHKEFIILQAPQKTQLVFCKYRQEVWAWEKLLRENGHYVLGCVGGETQDFSAKLMRRKPDFIVSTSCLSHGVNLPVIEAVHITYKLDSLDFWIQMIARGGRDGSPYKVYSTELIKEVKLNFWTNLLRNSKLMIRVSVDKMILGLEQWFLKAS